jgi:ABC-type sulfate transport system permease component
MSYSAPVTAKFSDKSVDDIEKAARKLGVTRSTLVREVVMRYLHDYLLASLCDRKK